jgi:hypothetical protein
MNIPSFTHAAVDRMIAAITLEANCAYRAGRLPNTSRALEHFKRADKSGLSDHHATLLFEAIMYSCSTFSGFFRTVTGLI